MVHWIGHPAVSPINGHAITKKDFPEASLPAYTLFTEPREAPSIITEQALRFLHGGFIYKPTKEVNDLIAAVDLTRSYLWRVRTLPTAPIIVCTAANFDNLVERLERGELTTGKKQPVDKKQDKCLCNPELAGYYHSSEENGPGVE